ncbi:uncharacterized protein LOC144152467 [Haemaphysalis longicornis]
MFPAAGAAPPGLPPGSPPSMLPSATSGCHLSGPVPEAATGHLEMNPSHQATSETASEHAPNVSEDAPSASSLESSPIPAGQASPLSSPCPSDQPLPDDEDAFSDMTDATSATIIYAQENSRSTDEQENFQTVMPPKRRRGSKRQHLTLSCQPIIKFPKHGRIVILKPTKAESVITRFNPLALKSGLESMAPDGVLQVRPNYRLNLLAVDTRNADATARLLKIKTIQGIPIQAYEPRSSECGAGVIRDVPVDLSEPEILVALRQKTPVKSVRRLGKLSKSVRIVFATEIAPEHVFLGYTRYRVYPYVETPRQCTKCQRFGHVATMCRLPSRCARCSGSHESSACDADNLRCPNCGNSHESTFARCPVLRKEKAIHKLKGDKNIDYKSAKATLHDQRGKGAAWKKSSSGTQKAAKRQPPASNTSDASFGDDFPPLPACGAVKPAAPTTATPMPSSQSAPMETSESLPPPAAASSSETAPAAASSIVTATAESSGQQANQKRPRRRVHQNSGNIFTLIVSVVEAIRVFLAPLSSPVAKGIGTIIDLVLPLLTQWR